MDFASSAICALTDSICLSARSIIWSYCLVCWPNISACRLACTITSSRSFSGCSIRAAACGAFFVSSTFPFDESVATWPSPARKIFPSARAKIASGLNGADHVSRNLPS